MLEQCCNHSKQSRNNVFFCHWGNIAYNASLFAKKLKPTIYYEKTKSQLCILTNILPEHFIKRYK